MDKELICFKCGQPLQLMKTSLSYMRHNLTVDLPKCPSCKQVYISEELVNGKMAEVEISLEEK